MTFVSCDLESGPAKPDLALFGKAVVMSVHVPWLLSVTGLLVGSCVFAAAPARAGEAKEARNLLPKPVFNADMGPSAGGWQRRAWKGKEDASWYLTSPSRSGGLSLSIASKKGTDAAWTAVVTVEPDTYYKLSGWIKTENVRGAVGALLNIQNMQAVRTNPVRGTTGWTEVSAVFRTGKQTRLEINCLFGGWGRSTGQAWYDDVALVKLAGAPKAKPEAVVTIDVEAPARAYSPMLFGGFIEHFHRQIYGGLFEPGSPLADERGFRKDVIAAMKELKLSVVRWPGGCFASGYHWKDGVGRTRKAVADPVWGVTDPNTFGTDEFVAWCRLVGCEPYICTNAGNGTPEEMAEWVAYCNVKSGPMAELRKAGGHAAPLNVRYWSVGNENWGAHEIGARRPAQWGPLVSRSAKLMRAVDPTIELAAAATPKRTWTLPLLKAAGSHLNYVAVHRYWLGYWRRNAMPDYARCIVHAEGPEQMISEVVAILDEAGCRGRIKIAFDEWNLRGWHHPGFPRKKPVAPGDEAAAELIGKRDINAIARQYTMADALFSASLLNACLRHCDDVGMANIAPIVNTRGPLYVHPKGIVRRTTFHVLAMYANLLADRVGAAEVQSQPVWVNNRTIPCVDAVATTDKTRSRWAIALVNRHPSKPAACTVKLGRALLDGTYQATILAGDSPEAYNDVDKPNRVTPEKTTLTFTRGVVHLPAHSLAIVGIAGKRR